MSSQLTSLVPIFDGSNWQSWAKQMRAYLMAHGQGSIVQGTTVEPVIPAAPGALAAGADATAINMLNEATHARDRAISDNNEWHHLNDMAIGNITLCLTPAIQQNFIDEDNAADLWEGIRLLYSKTTVPSIYKDFKEAVSIRFNPNQHPAAQFDKLAAAFARLGSVTIGTGANLVNLRIQNQYQALIALAALPPKWETQIAIITSSIGLEELDLNDVRDAIVAQYETETNRGQHKQAQNAQKISAIKHKRKRGNPSFNQQENQQQRRPSQSSPNSSGNQQQPRQRGTRGSGRGKAKGKGKQRDQPAHSHIASVAALPPPTSHTIAHIGSSSMTQRVVSEASPSTRTSGSYPSLNKALTLAERLEVKPTIQTVKTLEQRFAEFDDVVRSRSNYNYDEEYDSEMDIDMSQSISSRKPAQTESDIGDIPSESELCSAFDCLETESNDSNKENRALTPEYIDPGSIADLQDQFKDEPAQLAAMEMWDRLSFGGNTIRRRTSNELIEEAYRSHQEYLSGLVSPNTSRVATPCPSGTSLNTPEEVLDWGSDEEKYASPSLHTHNTNDHTVLVHSLRNIGGGTCNNTVFESEVTQLYNMSIDALDILKCEHNVIFSQCVKCRMKMSSMWLLDSGASAHFTNNKNDFIEYTPVSLSERIPVRTASHTIFVEGSGTVLLRHYINDSLVTTRVHPVLFIPTMSTRLLSMGEFLQQGMRIMGNSLQISLSHKNHLFVQCKPLITGQTLYWLDATSTAVDVQSAITPVIYKVDYDLMHCRLGHPSKEVLRQAIDNTMGFPDGIKIPTTTGVCPGCAQGKMPAALHPPSITRATKAFKRIHSDLKSFPIPSYHKYKYFIVFLDDYTSHVWVTLLRDKASAITALKQWLALIKNQFGITIQEWMSDAGGEYKSDAFMKHLKDAGITVLQSAPHTPQQNGRAERFMRTIMDKAQAMRLEACIPQSWWEFAVQHAAHCYNRTPISRLKWQTPYAVLNNEIPDISHLRVFGCGAYVHIPESRRVNKLSPKSELMIYLGRQSGMKADAFMRTPNTLFYSDKALFDELYFPKCTSGDRQGETRGTTRLNRPASNQPPYNASDDTTPGDLDNAPPELQERRRALLPDGVDAAPPDQPGDPAEQQAPPPVPDPVPALQEPRRSTQLRRVTTHPDNVYGPCLPTEITRDIEWTHTWQRLVENQPGSSRQRSSQDQTVPGGLPEQTEPDPPSTTGDNPQSEDEVDQQLLTRLAQEGGVKYLDLLLAKAVSPHDLESPDTSNIREWTFRDILKMPSEKQEEWRKACREELDSLRKRKVYELVDPPKDRKVIKNRWVFDIKSDGRKKARLVAKGFSQVEGIDYDEIFSPVVRFETVRMMLALVALKDWHISGLDVKTAFLYGDLDEELYMEQPEGFKIPGQQHKVMRLKRAIYGLKQAALAWWKALDKSMAALGCTRLLSDC